MYKMMWGRREASQVSWPTARVRAREGGVPHNTARADDHRLNPKETVAQGLLTNDQDQRKGPRREGTLTLWT